MSTRIIDAMRRIEILRGLSDHELLRVADLCKALRVPPGTTLFQEGDEGNEMYLIHEGSVRVVINTYRPDGTVAPSTINILHASQCFGELIVLNSGFRSATVIAMEPTTLIMLGGVQFRKLCVSNPHIGYCVIYNLAQDLANNLRSATLLLHGNVRLETAPSNSTNSTNSTNGTNGTNGSLMVDGCDQLLMSKDHEIKVLSDLNEMLQEQKRDVESELRQQQQDMAAREIEIRQLTERVQLLDQQKREAELQVRQHQQAIAAMDIESKLLNELTEVLDVEKSAIEAQLYQFEQRIAAKDTEIRQLTALVRTIEQEKLRMEAQLQQQQDDCDYLNAVVAGYRERERQRRRPPWAQ